MATTTVHQSYRNRSDRDLEAEFIFPFRQAPVRDFSMWVGGKRYRGEASSHAKTANLRGYRPPAPGPRLARIHRPRPLEGSRSILSRAGASKKSKSPSRDLAS